MIAAAKCVPKVPVTLMKSVYSALCSTAIIWLSSSSSQGPASNTRLAKT